MIMAFCFEHEQPYEIYEGCWKCAEAAEEEARKRTEDYYLESDREFVAELARIDL